MNSQPDKSPELETLITRLKKNLHGYPAGTAEAGEALLRTRDPKHLTPLIAGVLSYLTPQDKAARHAAMLSEAGISLQLVSDLQLDSLTMVELAFLVEDSLGIKLPDEELTHLVTLDDLNKMLQRQLGITAS